MAQHRILILEGNTPDLVERGHAGASGFVRFFAQIVPSLQVDIVSPYVAPMGDLRGYLGAVFTGASVEWSADDMRAKPQQAAVEAVFDAGLAAWGSCNGLQLAAVVLGGKVAPSPKGFEIGFAKDICQTGAQHRMHQGRRAFWSAPAIHRDVVASIPIGAQITAQNAHCPVQAMVYAQEGVTFWGTQYHPELHAKDIASYMHQQGGIFDRQEALAKDLSAMDHDTNAAARLGIDPVALLPRVCGQELINWLDFIGADQAQ